MSCEECQKAWADIIAYPYRWGNANIFIIGCKEHVREVMEVLTNEQKKRRI